MKTPAQIQGLFIIHPITDRNWDLQCTTNPQNARKKRFGQGFITQAATTTIILALLSLFVYIWFSILMNNPDVIASGSLWCAASPASANPCKSNTNVSLLFLILLLLLLLLLQVTLMGF